MYNKLGQLPSSYDRPATAYFGTAGLEDFPGGLRDLINKGTQFVDIVAGTGRALYQIAKMGKSIGANDRSSYPYHLLNAILGQQLSSTEQFFDLTVAACKPRVVSQRPGVVIRRATQYEGPFVNADTALYIDSVCRLAQQQGSSLLLSAVGHVLVKNFTHKKTSWAQPFADTPLKKMVRDVTPQDFWVELAKAIHQTWTYALTVPRNKHQICRDDAATAALMFDYQPGTVVYANGAAPWKGEAGANPYEFFTYDLGEILEQKTQPHVPFWKAGEEGWHQVYDDICKWMDNAFKAGADYFALVHESCAEPEPDWLFTELSKLFMPFRVEVLHREAPNFGAFDEFTYIFAR
jgi:hypothetical protein